MKRIIRKFKLFFRKLLFFKKLWEKYIAAWDVVDSIVQFNFLLFKEFYEKGEIGIVCWDSDEYHIKTKKQFDEIYNYITVIRPKKIKQINEVISVWSSHLKHWTEKINDEYVEWKSQDTKNSNFYFELHKMLEDTLYREDEYYLCMIMEIRNFLWT